MARAGQPYHHGDLRGALIRTALEMLERAGPEEMSLRALAEETGVSRSAPYSHFKDKRELMAAIAEVGFDRFREEMLRSDDPSANARRKFLDIGEGYVRFACANPGLFKLMFSAQLASLKDLGQLQRKSERTHGIFREGFDAFLVELGRTVPAGDTLRTLAWSSVHGLALLVIEHRLPGAPVDPADLAERVTGLFVSLVESAPAFSEGELRAGR